MQLLKLMILVITTDAALLQSLTLADLGIDLYSLYRLWVAGDRETVAGRQTVAEDKWVKEEFSFFLALEKALTVGSIY